MSPSPDPSHKSSKPPVPESAQLNEPTELNESPRSASDANQDTSASTSSEPASEGAASTEPSESTSLIPKRPLMRPVSRPQPPAKPASLQKPVAPPSPPAPPPGATEPPPESPAAGSSVDATSESQALVRQQPIPPPSEPKQYRAIGLVRGVYKPSEEQFTRGTMETEDGAQIEAVLLGRVMSLVKNHLDLEKEHLWVVYPRTRDTQQDLHVQIVGVWEPEKLHRETTDAEAVAEPTEETEASAAATSLSPGFEDDYFSIRGEVVFNAPDNENVIVKIQQAPRKDSDKAKAFKLQLKGVLPNEKALGYFWDLNVKREAALLVITSGTPIGLVPPKKRKKRAGGPFKGERKPFKKSFEGRGGAGKPGKPAAVGSPQRREPLPKPSKRTDQSES